MNNKFTFFIALLLSFIFNVSFAQDGANDPTFNPGDTGYYNGANAGVLCITPQTDSKLIIGGDFVYYKGENRGHIARLNADATLDMSFNVGAGANRKVKAIATQPDGKILIGGEFTAYNGILRRGIARLNSDGTLDGTFNPGSGLGNGFEITCGVNTIVVQTDGKIIIGGYFNTYNGAPTGRIARLNSNGTIDDTFIATGAETTINKILLQPDGKIFVSGSFLQFNNEWAPHICRLNSNGAVDTDFDNNWILSGSGISSMDIQADGKIIVAGGFMYIDDEDHIYKNIARINIDGSLDTSFIQNFNHNSQFSSVTVQADGKILVAGLFSLYGQDSYRYLMRLNNDGAEDTLFVRNNNSYDNGLDTTAECLLVMQDGKILLGGSFMSYNNKCKHFLLRISNQGDVDETYIPGNGTSADNTILSSAIQPDGKIIIAGPFNYYNGQEARSVARLSPGGDIDTTFNTGVGANAPVRLSALQPDGKIIIVGDFTTYNGSAVNKAARLNSDGTLDVTFNLDNTIDINTPYSIEILPNGEILIGASITYDNGTDFIYINTLFRLNSDGSVDSTFLINDARIVKDIIALPDGKIIVAYAGYTNLNIQYAVARLNTDGSLDNSFQVLPANTIGYAFSMALQPDGKVVVVGFTDYNPQNPLDLARIIRLNTDGSLDASLSFGINNQSLINKIKMQNDGKFIIFGIIHYGGAMYNIARINNDGNFDETFSPSLYDGDINDIHLQPEGKLLITGSFYAYNGAGRNRIARIMNSDIMGVATPDATSNNVMAYRSSNALQITSIKQLIKEVQIYDIAGRLLSDTKNINDSNTSIDDISPSHKILIVNIKLADNATVSKKIYY